MSNLRAKLGLYMMPSLLTWKEGERKEEEGRGGREREGGTLLVGQVEIET